MSIDLTKGNITAKLLLVTWPIIANSLLQMVINLVDIGMVGRLNSESIAAVGFAKTGLWGFLAIFAGYNQAINSLVARFIGAGDKEKAEQAAYHALLFTTYLGIIMGILALIFIPFFVRQFSLGEMVTSLTIDYLNIIASTVLVVLFIYILTGIFEGMGHTRTELYVMASINVFNIILNYFFIFGDEFYHLIPIHGLGLGVRGAAYSFVISRAVGSAILILLLSSGRYPVRLRMLTFKPSWDVVQKINHVGLPLGMMGIASSFAFLIVYSISARTSIGTNAISAITVGQSVEAFAFLPAVGLGVGTQVMAGQNIGAGKIDRVLQGTRIAAWITFIYLSFWALMYLVFSQSLVSLFTQDPIVLYAASSYIIIFAIPVTFYFTLPLAGTLRAAGDTTMLMIFNLLALYAVRVPFSYYLALKTRLDYDGIWWAMSMGMVVELVLILFRYRQGVWKRIKL